MKTRKIKAVDVTSRYIKQCPLCGVHFGVAIPHEKECKGYTTITEPDGTVKRVEYQHILNGSNVLVEAKPQPEVKPMKTENCEHEIGSSTANGKAHCLKCGIDMKYPPTASPTPRPWNTCAKLDGTYAVGMGQLDVAKGMTFENAAHIVKCVNLHDDLYSALKNIVAELDRQFPDSIREPLRSLVVKADLAIAKAEGAL